MAGLPRDRAWWVAPHDSNVQVMQGTRALLKFPGRPWQGFPDFWGRVCAPQGDAGAGAVGSLSSAVHPLFNSPLALFTGFLALGRWACDG